MKSPSETRGTLAYFKYQTWRNINRRTINGSNPRPEANCMRYIRRGVRLELTKDQFYAWCDEQALEIIKLYSDGWTPSIDRIDPNGHYQLGNIRILSTTANAVLGARLASHKRKLTDDQVREIRDLVSHLPHKEIAAKYGVNSSVISAIKARRIHKSL